MIVLTYNTMFVNSFLNCIYKYSKYDDFKHFNKNKNLLLNISNTY